jgi:hypothetical protein
MSCRTAFGVGVVIPLGACSPACILHVLEIKPDLEMFELTNPNLRQLVVPGHPMSLAEAELIRSRSDQYPNTRTWARLLYSQVTTLHGLGWRPRLGGEGTSYALCGNRYQSTDLGILSGPTSIESGHGFDRILEWRSVRAFA